MSPTSTVVVGNLLVVWVAWDSAHNPAAPQGNLNGRLAIADSKNNIWSTLACDTDGGTNIYSMAGLFVTRVRTEILTTDTITFTHQTSLVAKGMSAHEFSMDSTMRWATTDNGPVVVTSRAIDPPAITIGGLDSQAYLFLHTLGAEGPNTDTYTWDADYTQIAQAGTSGGVDDTNITVNGGYRVATLTTDTVDVTSLTADRDYTQVYVALCEVPYEAGFPSAPVLDAFNRADENPLDNLTWNTGTCTPSFNNTRKLRIVSQVVASSDGVNGGGQWWLANIPTNNAEVFCSMPTAPTTFNLGFSIVLHGSGCGPLATRNGYEAGWRKREDPSQAVVADNILLGGAGNVSNVEPFVRIWRPITAGNKLGIQRRTKVNNCWIDEGSGWEWAGAIYFNTGSQVFSSGLLGLQAYDPVTRLDNFGGGSSPPLSHLLPILHVGA